jgi:hypothetical protein
MSEGLTTEERRDVRQGLMDLGFRRGSPLSWDASVHLDKGDGAYTEEWWGPGNTHATLTWQPKARAALAPAPVPPVAEGKA